jgi:hypothetical protein
VALTRDGLGSRIGATQHTKSPCAYPGRGVGKQRRPRAYGSRGADEAEHP